ncbi:MAG: hypothetical protein V1701_02530 [Planctomycetota bacterium]
MAVKDELVSAMKSAEETWKEIFPCSGNSVDVGWITRIAMGMLIVNELKNVNQSIKNLLDKIDATVVEDAKHNADAPLSPDKGSGGQG